MNNEKTDFNEILKGLSETGNTATINGQVVPFDRVDNGLMFEPMTTIEGKTLWLYLGAGTKATESGVAKVDTQMAYHFWKSVSLAQLTSMVKARKI